MKLILTDKQRKWLEVNSAKLNLDTISSKLASKDILINFNKNEIATIKHLATELSKGLKNTTIPEYEKRGDKDDYLEKAKDKLGELQSLLKKIRNKGKA